MHEKSILLITTKPGQVAPTDLIDRAIQEFTFNSGFAVALKEEGSEFLELISETYSSAPTRESFDDTMLSTSDAFAAFSFGKVKAENDEDIQPFLLVKGPDYSMAEAPNELLEGPPALVAFLVGNYSAYEKKDSGHSAEYNAAQQLGAKLQAIFDKSEYDLGKVSEHIRSAAFKKEAEALYSGEGLILLMDADGEVTKFGNATIEELEWGWAYPPLAKAVEAAPITVTKRANRFLKGAATAEVPSPAPAKVEELPKASVPAAGKASSRFTAESAKPTSVVAAAAAEVAPKAATAVKPPADNLPDIIYAHPPHNMSNNKSKEWYQAMTGTYPDGFKDKTKPTVAIRKEVWLKAKNHFRTNAVRVDPSLIGKDGVVKSFQELDKTKLAAPAVAEAKAEGQFPSKGSEVKAAVKDTAPHNVSASVTAEKLPILGPDARNKIKLMLERGTLLKFVDGNSAEVLDPKALNDLEKTLTSFNEAFGVTGFEMTDRWSYESLCKLARELPEAAAKLIHDYRLDSMRHRAGKIAAPAGTIVDTGGAPITSKKTPDLEVDVTAAAPEKKRASSRFLR